MRNARCRRFVGFLCALALSGAGWAGADDPPVAPSDEDAKAQVTALKSALRGKDVDGKLRTITACTDCPHPAVAAALGGVLTSEADDVRIAAAGALGTMKGLDVAARALTAALPANEENGKVLPKIFGAIGDVGHLSAVAAVVEWINRRIAQRDKDDIQGMVEAIGALGGLKSKGTMDALLDLWRKNQVVGANRKHHFRESCNRAFQQAVRKLFAGEKHNGQKEWDDWWREYADKYRDDLTPKP
ncbi:MAG: HEAT repeat domain-containing protein [Planctomycetes bacterium]|nr:HEAT repeat domain-containing protein [Planctomycetota bacterium]